MKPFSLEVANTIVGVATNIVLRSDFPALSPEPIKPFYDIGIGDVFVLTQ